MICPSCHTENRDGAKFCDECGAKLPRAAFEQIEGAEPAQALNIIDNEEPTEDEVVPDMHEADAENAEAADGGQDGEDVDSGAVVQLDDALASDEDAEDASDMACSNEEAAAGDADDADSSDIAMQDDFQPQQDVTESSQEAEEDAANRFEGSHAGADDVAHQRTHVLDLPDIRNLAFESEKTQTLGPKPASPAIMSGWEPDLSGFDEFLVYPGYVPPKAAWHSGDTMQMPRITDADLSQQKDFIAPDPNKKKRDRKKKKAEKAKACESQQHNQQTPKETQPAADQPEKEQAKHAEKESTPVVPDMKPKDEKKPESKGKRLPGSRIAAIVALAVLIAASAAAGVTYQMEL
ncbi:zinc ribbon domain-containing protein, partial [Senegalimassilia anaerobia]|uniref:zinc ribbon domain-containing protein n=1 Tax=Senegalimassilia anaerobia TaxID=1473216 RepID=UPI003A979F24